MSEDNGKAAAGGENTRTNGVQKEADAVAEKTPYYQKRISQFEKFYAREQEAREKAKEADEKIVVVLPDGKQIDCVKGVTTPIELAAQISKSLAKKSVVASVDGQEWDMTRPLESNCALQIFGFESSEGQEVGESTFCALMCRVFRANPCIVFVAPQK